MSMLKEVVRNVLMYYIVLTVIMSLIGDSAYKKYIDMFTGLVLILIILNPIIRFFKADSVLDYQIRKNQLFAVTSQESQDLMVAEVKQQEMLVKQYKDIIAGEVSTQLENNELYPVDVDISIDEDIKSETFGSVEAISIEYSDKKIEESENNGDYIVEEVEIPVVRIGNKQKVAEKIHENIETKQIKIQIANHFGISVEQVSMQLVKYGKEEKK